MQQIAADVVVVRRMSDEKVLRGDIIIILSHVFHYATSRLENI